MFFKDETGTSIVEVMVATVVFMIIMVGGLNYFFAAIKHHCSPKNTTPSIGKNVNA